MSGTSEIPIGLYMLFVNIRNQCDFCHINSRILSQSNPNPLPNQESMCVQLSYALLYMYSITKASSILLLA